MPVLLRSSLALVATLLLATSAFADVKPAPLFRDGAVLQRGEPLPVWGAADPGEKVSVSFAGKTVSAVAGPDGRWSASLPPLEASATSRELVISGKNKVVVRDVLVGEVWLASGQSNMEWPLDYAANGKAEAQAADFPLVRQFKTAKRSSYDPLPDVDGDWAPALPATAGQFSAVAYYFAVDLHRQLKVPVGIINSSWGGSAIEPWISREAYEKDPKLAPRLAAQAKAPRAKPEELAAHEAAVREWEAKRKAAQAARQAFREAAPKAPAHAAGPRTAAGLNNAMIHPHAPFALRGFIWYQGESNVSRAAEYTSRLEALVSGWRKQFHQDDAPVYWVQLPNFDLGNRNADNWHWAELREAQTRALSIPRTGQAVTIDVGEPKGLHPRDKKSVGGRLALLAFARTYGFKDVVDSGPVVASAIRDGSAYRIAYEPSRSALRAAPAGLTGFELAGADQVFHPAEARIEGATVVVTSTAVPAPVAVRYAYRNAPVAGLFNEAGLPAAPFRSDDWPAPRVNKPAPPPPPLS